MGMETQVIRQRAEHGGDTGPFCYLAHLGGAHFAPPTLRVLGRNSAFNLEMPDYKEIH
jgi:hypothetical protein